MLEDFQGWKLGPGAEQCFPLIQEERRDIDQTYHSWCRSGRLRNDETAIGVADQQCRSFQLCEQVTRRSYVVSQRGVCMLRGDDKMALGLECRNHFAPAGSISPETMYEDNVRRV